jgi:hypothetical protein
MVAPEAVDAGCDPMVSGTVDASVARLERGAAAAASPRAGVVSA